MCRGSATTCCRDWCTPTPGWREHMTWIQTTHAGSLPRPPELAELVLKYDRHELTDPARLQDAIAKAVRDVVRRQVEMGIDTVGDGEYSKASYVTYVKERLSGFDGAPRNPLPQIGRA